MRWVAICVPVGTPAQAALAAWLRRWGGFLRYASPNEGCGCCVDIYFVETLPDVLAELPPGVVVVNGQPRLADLELVYCRCLVRHLSGAERWLLEDALDAHNRLWDGESSVAEVLESYSAAAEALRGTPHSATFERAVAALADVMRSGLPAVEQWSLACGGTDDLRGYVARQLRWADESGAADAKPTAAPDREGT